MTEHTDTETLADVVMEALCDSVIWQDRHIGELEWHLCDGIADRIDASPWLAARVDAARRDALTDAAAELCDRNASHGYTEEARHFGRIYGDLLRKRAAALAVSDPTQPQP